jgi:YD repeat-containing protein
VSVVYPDATLADPSDAPTRRYHYEDSRFPYHLTGLTDENGNRYAIWSYDAAGRAVSSEHAGGVDRVTFAYNVEGTTTVTDALGQARTYTYDVQGNLATVTNALGQITQITAYDAHGRPLTLQDPNGAVTELRYDARGWLLSQSINSSMTRFDYDPVGNLIKLTLPMGAYLSYRYAAAQRLTGISDSSATAGFTPWMPWAIACERTTTIRQARSSTRMRVSTLTVTACFRTWVGWDRRPRTATTRKATSPPASIP